MSSINGLRIKTPLKLKPMTAHRSKYPQGSFKDKVCKWCEDIFEPIAPSHHYCCEECRQQVAADRHYRRVYNISVRDVHKMLIEQDWKCAVCRSFGFKMREDHVSGLNVDHEHSTGKVRALLCHNCNRGLGLFQEKPIFLRSAANYLECHNDA